MPTKQMKKATVRPYVIVRCYGAGVHAGELVSIDGEHVELANSRRVWRWSGAASLSELAVHGARNVTDCRFAVAVPRVLLLDAKEILYCQPEGEKMIRTCPEWRA